MVGGEGAYLPRRSRSFASARIRSHYPEVREKPSTGRYGGQAPTPHLLGGGGFYVCEPRAPQIIEYQ